MNKSPIDRYNEIKKEIWQISESYSLLLRDKLISELNDREMTHAGFLHFRMRELVTELKQLSDAGVGIPLIYKKLVNKLIRDLSYCVSQDYGNELRGSGEMVNFLL